MIKRLLLTGLFITSMVSLHAVNGQKNVQWTYDTVSPDSNGTCPKGYYGIFSGPFEDLPDEAQAPTFCVPNGYAYAGPIGD